MKRAIVILIQIAVISIIFLALFLNSNLHLTGFATNNYQPNLTTGKTTGGSVIAFPDLEMAFDQTVYLAENIPKTVSLKITNTGQEDLTNISLTLDGLDELSYHVSPGTIDLLKKGETQNFDIVFSIINMSGEKDFNYTIRTNEITKEESGKIVILSILDYLREEIDRLTARIADTGSRITDNNLKIELGKCNDTLTKIKSEISKGQFIDAKDNIVIADDCIDNIEKSGNGLLPNIGHLSWIIIGLSLAIMIIVIIRIIYKKSTKFRVSNPRLRGSREKVQPKPNMKMKEKIINEKSFQDKLKNVEDKLRG